MKNNQFAANAISIIIPPYLTHCRELLKCLDSRVSLLIGDRENEQAKKGNNVSLPKTIGTEWIMNNLAEQEYAIALWAGVTCGRRLLKIPNSIDDIQTNLKLLEGRQHQVLMMIGRIINGKLKLNISKTRVKFKRMSDHERQNFIDNNSNWHDRLGGYIGPPSNINFIKAINGDASAVYGISLYTLANIIKNLYC